MKVAVVEMIMSTIVLGIAPTVILVINIDYATMRWLNGGSGGGRNRKASREVVDLRW